MRYRPLLGAILLIGLLMPLDSCTSPSLTSIVISPSTFTTTLSNPPMWTQYTATGYYTHPGHQPITRDITNEVTWLSYTPLLVTISPSGVATVAGYAIGFSQITASLPGFNGDIISNASTFTVNAPSGTTLSDFTSLPITPSNPTITGTGKTEAFGVTGTTASGSAEDLTTAATWTSSNPNVATIGAKTGLATAVGAGSSIIVVTYTNSDGVVVTANTTLTVQ